MKIKYTKTKETEHKDTLLEILEWEDSYDREEILYETDSIKIRINFWQNHKSLYVRIKKLELVLTLNTDKLTPEKINDIIVSAMKITGATYEN